MLCFEVISWLQTWCFFGCDIILKLDYEGHGFISFILLEGKKSLSSYYLSKLLSPKVRSMYPLYQPYIRMLLGLISLNNEILSFCKNVRKLDRWKMIPGYLTFHFFISDVGYFPVSSYLKSNLRVIWSWSLLIHWVWGIYYFNF